MKSTAKVGLLVIIFVGLIVGAFSILGKSLFARKNNIYFVRMKDAGGIVEGTKVLMAGVRIGTVRQVSLVNPHEAQLTLALREDFRLPMGSQAIIPGSLVGFGESELSIDAPASSAGFLPEGSTIPGNKGGPLDSILPDNGKSIFGNIDRSLAALRKILQDQGLQKDLKNVLITANKTLVGTQQTLLRFSALSDRANNLLASNQGNIQEMIASMKGTLHQVNGMATNLAGFIKEGKLQKGTTDLLAKAEGIEDQSSKLLDRLNQIAADPSIQQNVKDTTKNFAATSEKGPAIADHLEKITANTEQITEESKGLPKKLSDVMDRTVKLEDSLTSLADKFNSVHPPSAAGLKDLHTELDLIRETNPGYWRTDVNATYPLKDGFITFGVYDAFESNKINLQLAHAFGNSLDVRYGVYASKAGIGVDYNLTRRLSVRTDLFDINSLELDSRLRYDFGGGFIGWAGLDRAFGNTASWNFGIGVRE